MSENNQEVRTANNQEVRNAPSTLTVVENKVRRAIYYKVNLNGYRVNLLVLLLVLAVIVGGVVYYRRNAARNTVTGDLTLSTTSSMGDIARQMGGFSINTPNFIKNL
jgi:hypothetical protein